MVNYHFSSFMSFSLAVVHCSNATVVDPPRAGIGNCWGSECWGTSEGGCSHYRVPSCSLMHLQRRYRHYRPTVLQHYHNHGELVLLLSLPASAKGS
ncbi:hypothetical protein BT96DRAFT_613637 [Gymnopus androsaceus JB14]|uniref:Secreted protein n=1 Tax=Gymnopus androsaceus JB14 TaxID=1447944 RepID=A0A6A4GHN1_9AGAR|nr:hypothetical protein BT96DRAFT_613637 [Gymnopus androsaceus JB14]